MKKLQILKAATSALFAVIIVSTITGCSKDETNSLSESISNILKPVDGFWKGSTSQDYNFTFNIGKNGTVVTEGLQFSVYCEENWGWVVIKVRLKKELSIGSDKSVYMNEDGLTLKATFDSPESCSGTISLRGGFTYGWSYLTFSESCTWNARFSGGDSFKSSESTDPLLSGDTEHIGNIIDSESVTARVFFCPAK